MKARERTCLNKDCKKKFTPRFNSEVVCSFDCKIQYAIVKGRKNIEGKKKKERKELKQDRFEDNITRRSWVVPKMLSEVQAMARLIDSGLPCLARGNYPKQMHGGHIYPRSSHGQMSYNLHNIHRQSAQSNKSFNDDGLLREKLAEEYGEEYLDKLKELRKLPPLKISMPDLYEVYRKARKLHRELKKTLKPLDKPLPKAMRIRLREEINNKLGIYESTRTN